MLEMVVYNVPPFDVLYVPVTMLVEYLVALSLGQRIESIERCHSGASSWLSGLNLGTFVPLSFGFGNTGKGHVI
jgi:hypothetical protein